MTISFSISGTAQSCLEQFDEQFPKAREQAEDSGEPHADVFAKLGPWRSFLADAESDRACSMSVQADPTTGMYSVSAYCSGAPAKPRK